MATSQSQMRIVILGKTGSGKSSLGNSLLHSRDAFHATQSAASITSNCEVKEYQQRANDGQVARVTVVDTPGFFDSNPSITNAMVEQRITSQIFQMTAPGVHAFLIVIAIGRFTPEEKQTVDFVRKMFGADATKYCIVVFTHPENLDSGQTLEEFIHTSPALEELVQACGCRTLDFDNRLNGRYLEKKINQLMEMIDKTIRNNKGRYFTNVEFQRIERKRQEEQKRQEEAELQKIKAEKDELIERTRREERKKYEELLKASRESGSAQASSNGNSILSQLAEGTVKGLVPLAGKIIGMPPMNHETEAVHSDVFTVEFMPTSRSRGGSSMYQGPNRDSMFSGARRGH